MFKINLLSLAIAASLSLATLTASANIQSQMDSMFDSMSSTTEPGAYETATRGVIAGGSMRIRNKIATTPVVSFRPPSLQAGCGGIDMFAGSFSFINAQQFVQTLRSVASNAVGVASGYAFKLALNAMGPTVHNVIQNLQEVMQKMNELMSNSCQLATGLVTDTFSAFGANLDNKDKQKSAVAGLADNFESMFSTGFSGNKSAGEKVAAAGKDESCIDKGNVIWCQMQKRNTQSTFLYGSRQTDELIMSMTGSVIVGDYEDAADGKGKSRKIDNLDPISDVDLKYLIEGKKGEKVKIYDCKSDTETCIQPEEQEIEFDGLAAKIEKAFKGGLNGSSVGIIRKWSTNTGPFTSEEIGIISAMQATSFSAMIQKLSQRSEQVAGAFVSSHSKLIAREATYSMAKSYLDAARSALAGSEMSEALREKPNDFMNKAYDRLNQQYQVSMTEYGSDAGMFADYAKKMEVMPAPGFLSALGAPATNTGSRD